MSWYKNGSHEAVVCLSGEKKQDKKPKSYNSTRGGGGGHSESSAAETGLPGITL